MKHSNKTLNNILEIHLLKIYLSVSFKCSLKAVLHSNCERKNSRSVPFDLQNNEVSFNQKIFLKSDTNKKEFLKVTIIILKENTKKMVGSVEVDLAWDPIKRGGGNKYRLQRCPQENAKVKMEYYISKPEGWLSFKRFH